MNLLCDTSKIRFRAEVHVLRRCRSIRSQQSIRPKPNLLQTLFTGDIKDAGSTGRQSSGGLKQQGALAHPRLSAQQDRRSGHQASTQHPVEFTEPNLSSRHFQRFDLIDPNRSAAGLITSRRMP